MDDSNDPQTESRRYPTWYTGDAGEFFLLVIVNWLLTAVTLGIFSFWAKTRVRRHLWAHTTFDGEPFEYTGRGIELFLGALIVGLILVPFLVVFSLVLQTLLATSPGGAAFLYLMAAAVLLFLFGLAQINARRYQVSRTRWRGVRLALVTRTGQFAVRLFLYRLANIACLGLLTPKVDTFLMSHYIGDMRFGSASARTDYQVGPLYRPFLLSLAATVAVLALLGGTFAAINEEAIGILSAAIADGTPNPMQESPELALTLFISAFFFYLAGLALLVLAGVYYECHKYRYLARQTTLEGLHFAFAPTLREWIWLYVGNMLLIVFTFGLGYPLALLRSVRFGVNNLRCQGTIDYDAVLQVERQSPELGEGLAAALDIGGI